jgi:dTDP-4-dehydrorhamnose reductase
VECTVNRVGDRFFNQLAHSGHAHRLDDLDRFAALGIRAIRYPVLWELTAPDDPAAADWSWPDARLGRLRELGVRPIVGLVHHGSGPRGTNLLDPAFPERLARYAGAVAARYPWVTDYTPVNEPLTTARFSALYGHWYPHARDEGSFLRALLTQCQAVAAAMRAIRTVNPAARLVQTEDLGEVFATPALAAQAAYENERRWLSLDLLTGRVRPGHPLWEPVRAAGLGEDELAALADAPCPPDIVGINHYLTSERLLDERRDRYPIWAHGGNGRQAYADIEAVRVRVDEPGGWRRLLRAAWERYGLPVAATEVHLGCTREEQLRWLAEAWAVAGDLREVGVDVRAVTAWSLLGAFGWNRLVTEDGGAYEPGVFDLRAPQPRPTALAGLIGDLAAGREPRHPVLAVRGWWRRPSRFQYPPVDRWGADADPRDGPELPPMAPPLLVVGPPMPLAEALVAHCAVRAIPPARLELDSPGDTAGWSARFASALGAKRPWAVVLAGVADGVPQSDTSAWTEELAAVARTCADACVPLLLCSSDRVFAPVLGTGGPFTEADPPNPEDVIGRAFLAAERVVLTGHPSALVVRSGPLFGGEQDLSGDAAAELSPAEGSGPADATVVSPTYLPDLVEAGLDLLIDGESGVWHLANPGAATWHDLVRRATAPLGAPEGEGAPTASKRRRVLASERGWPLPPLEDAIGRARWHRQPREGDDTRLTG